MWSVGIYQWPQLFHQALTALTIPSMNGIEVFCKKFRKGKETLPGSFFSMHTIWSSPPPMKGNVTYVKSSFIGRDLDPMTWNMIMWHEVTHLKRTRWKIIKQQKKEIKTTMLEGVTTIIMIDHQFSLATWAHNVGFINWFNHWYKLLFLICCHLYHLFTVHFHLSSPSVNSSPELMLCVDRCHKTPLMISQHWFR